MAWWILQKRVTKEWGHGEGLREAGNLRSMTEKNDLLEEFESTKRRNCCEWTMGFPQVGRKLISELQWPFHQQAPWSYWVVEGFVCTVRWWEETGVSQSSPCIDPAVPCCKFLLSTTSLHVGVCNDKTILPNAMGSTYKQIHLENIAIVNVCT